MKHIIQIYLLGLVVLVSSSLAGRNDVMAVISTSTVLSSLKKFPDYIAAKKALGIEVLTVNETQWGGGATNAEKAVNIRTWLQNNYVTSAITDVLLIGSFDEVPLMEFTGYAGGTNCYSDWPYCQLTGDYKSDKTCEVNVGRIPIYSDDYAGTDSILQKIIDYESTTESEAAWRKNCLLANGTGTTVGGVLLEAIHQDVIQKTPGWKDVIIDSSTTILFTNTWKNNPFGVVTWFTHTAPTMAQNIISSADVPKIGNNYPAFVFCQGCSGASPNNPNNLAIAMLRHCAIAAVGATNLTYYVGTSFLNSGNELGWVYKFTKFLIYDHMDIGDAMTALREMDPGYGWYNRAPYVLYGDPTVGLNSFQTAVTDVPQTPATGAQTILSVCKNGHEKSVVFHLAQKLHTEALITIYSVHGSTVDVIPVARGKQTVSWNGTAGMAGQGVYIARLRGYAGAVKLVF